MHERYSVSGIDLKRVEELRQILERKQSRVVQIEEASQVASALINFYEILAFEDEAHDAPTRT